MSLGFEHAPSSPNCNCSKHETSIQSCLNAGPVSQAVIQHSANKSCNVFTGGPLNVFPFHKQIYIKVQKLSGDFRFLKL